MGAITNLYECKHLQTYNGLKQTLINVNSCTEADTIDLSDFEADSTTNFAYKNTKTVVDAATATGYDNTLDISDISTSDIRFAIGINMADGSFVPIVASSTSTLTIGAGPSSEEVEILIFHKSY